MSSRPLSSDTSSHCPHAQRIHCSGNLSRAMATGSKYTADGKTPVLRPSVYCVLRWVSVVALDGRVEGGCVTGISGFALNR